MTPAPGRGLQMTEMTKRRHDASHDVQMCTNGLYRRPAGTYPSHPRHLGPGRTYRSHLRHRRPVEAYLCHLLHRRHLRPAVAMHRRDRPQPGSLGREGSL